MVYGFIALLVLLLVWVVWIVVRQWQRSRVTVVAAEAVAFATPDLRDHNVHAGQLAPDEWLQLAQTEMARGEWRLALRAVYLATLARFAADGLVSLARFKTNLDYEREVRRRATARTEVVDRFRERRRTFEDVWYGERAADEATVRTWFDELRQPKAVP
jgi:hypothetical protein